MVDEPRDPHQEDSDPLSEFGLEPDGAWLDFLREATTADSLGTIGRYELLSEAHRGGQGIVYRARDRSTGETVALKRLIAGRFSTAEAIARFRREIEIVSTLDHPGIVRTIGMELADQQPVLVMQWIDGQPIHDWAKTEKPDTSRVLQVTGSICDAMQFAHRHGVLHRDLKPSNILITPTGAAVIVDFGIARPMNPDSTRLTASDEFLGTLVYAAPEQVRGESDQLDARADVYAIGVILYELLTGRLPYDTSSGIGNALSSYANDRITPPSQELHGISYELDTIVTKALAVDPTQRYQSVDALGEDLRRLRQGEPILAHPPSAWYPLRKLLARTRMASGMAITAFAMAIALAIVMAVQSDRVVEAHELEKEARRRAEDMTEFVETLFRDLSPLRSGEPASIVRLVEQATKRIDNYVDEDPLLRAKMRHTLGTLLSELGHYPPAIRVLRESLKIRRAHQGTTADDLASSLTELANAIYNYEPTREAIDLAEELVELRRNTEGSDVPRALALLGAIESIIGDREKSIRHLDEAQAILDREQRPADSTRARVLRWRAANAVSDGNPEALALASEAVAIKIAEFGDDHPRLLDYFSVQASAALLSNEIELGLTAQRKAVKIAKSISGPDSTLVGKMTARLGQLVVAKGQPGEAIEMLERARDLLREERLRGTGWYVVAVTTLARAQEKLGRHDEAVASHRDLLELRRVVARPMFDQLLNLGYALYFRAQQSEDPKRRTTDLDEAEELFLEALTLETSWGAENDALRGLMSIAVQQGDLVNAIAYTEQFHEFIADLPVTGEFIRSYAGLALRQMDLIEEQSETEEERDYSDAIETAQRALELSETAALDPTSSEHCYALAILSRALWGAKRAEECAKIGERLLAVEEAAAKHWPKLTLQARSYTARSHHACGRVEIAIERMSTLTEQLAQTEHQARRPGFYSVLATWCDEAGQPDEAAKWRELAGQ